MTTATSSATNAVTTSTATLAPPTPRPAQYSISDLVLTFFKEKAKDIAKTGSYLAFWATQAMPDLPKSVTTFNDTLRDFKNFISVTELPQKLYDLGGSVSALTTNLTTSCDKVGKASREVFKNTLALINTTADTIDFARLFVPISKEALRWISGINFAATIGFSGNGVLEQIQHISGMKTLDPNRTTFHMINIARDVSYLALGIIGFSFVVTATPFVPWMIVACLTSGLVFSLSSYFYEKIYDPENKGKDLNPAILVENASNQRNYERSQAAAGVV